MTGVEEGAENVHFVVGQAVFREKKSLLGVRARERGEGRPH